MPIASEFRNLIDLLSWRAAEHPEATAFRFFGDGESESGALSYGRLVAQARVLAAELQARQLQGQRVLLLYPPGLDFITAFIGCLFAGAIPVPAYPPEPHRLSHTLQRLQSIIRDARSPAILTDSLILGMAQQLLQRSQHPELERLQWLQSDHLIAHGSDAAWRHPQPAPDALAFLQYTSGSTAEPKGVMISHRNLLANLTMLQTAAGHRPREAKLVCWVPFYHDMGLVGHLLYTLFNGGETLIMPPVAFLKKPLRWLKLISDHRANASGGPNFAYDLCVRKIPPAERAQLDLSCLKLTLNAAEPIHAATVESFNAAFTASGLQANSQAPAYGMAETAVFISISPPECRPRLLAVDREALEAGRVLTVSEDHPRAQKLVACGRTWLEARLLIVDPERGVDIGEDAVGEIWIQGPHVALGYWNQPEASAETFQASLQDQPGHFLRTGDLGFVHAGEVYVTGRLKDLIIVRGRNLYPQDLERSIDQLRSQLPEIRPGCGVAFARQVPDAEIVAAETSSSLPAAEEVVFFQEITADEQSLDPGRLVDLSRRIAETLADEHLIPVQAVVLVKPGTLPKTSSGKLMRQACRQAYAHGLDTSPIQVLFHWRAHGQHTAAEATSAAAGAPVPANEPAYNTDWRRWLLDWLSQACRLPVDAIDLEQRFQTLGLDSLLSVRLVADLEQMGLGTLPGPLPDTLLWEFPTPRALLAFLSGTRETPAAGHLPVRAQGLAPIQEIPFTNEPIAVISMACRFPGGANTPEAFWELLASGRDAIGPIPASRWDVEAYYDPQKGQPGKMYLREGGFLEDVDRFEPGFFKISPREAVNMDPQQRLLLELAWELLEAAGIPASSLEQSSTGVFIGLSNVDYALLGRNERINVYTGTGNAPSVAAGRLAYWLGLQGPVMTLDTACSSSLVAVHQACQSLRLGECSLALAGGVNLILSPEVNIYFCQLQALAPDGRCKSFDAGADGFVRSEGGGLVLLKRLSDALRDQDPILGLVRGSAVNHDGPSNGLTAPNGRAQQQVIRQALRQAGVAAEAVSFVETHGTGTPLGDPIEVQALEQVMLRSDRVTPLNLGALKSNLGHLESAAGVAGLIKTLLALKHRTLPANLHFQQLNPRIEADPRLHFPSTATPWTSATPRLAGISSFGISGTNAHLILEEYSEPEPIAAEGPGMEHQDYPITLSAHSEVALIARLGQTLDWLSQSKTELNLLRDLAFTTTQRRDHLRHRWALSARDPDALSGALSAALDAGAADLIGPLNDPLIGFVFPGQGAQWPGMGRELFAREAVFREAIARCEAAFAAEVDWRLSEVLETATAEDYARMELIQPVIFAIQVGLSALWQSWGLRPQIVIGHSMGEVAAAYLAGALSLEDAARIICRRSRLLGQQSQQSAGGMLFTALTPAACEAYLSKEIMIGVYNGPDATVLTGERQALEDLAQTLADQEIFARFVQVPVAAHSWQIDSFEAPLKAALAELQPHQPTLRMLSTVTAGPLESPPGPDYWYDNLRQPVRFAQTVEQALAEGVNLWIEISPHPLLLQTLQTSARQAQKPIRTVASLRRDQPEVRTLHQSLLQAYLAGAQPRWEKLAPTAGKVLVLPSYPWQRQSCWLADPAVMSQQAPSPSAMPQAKTVVPQAAPASAATRDAPPIPQQLYQLHWEKSPTPSPQTFPTGPWLIFSDHEALNQSLTLLLQAHGQHCLFVHQGHDLQLGQPPFVLDPLQPDHYLQLMQHLNRHLKRPVNGVIFAWPGRSESPEARGFSPAQAETAYSALQHLLQQLEELAGPPPRLYLVSRGAWQPAGLDPGLSLAQSVWWGLGRSAFYEYPQWHCTQIDLSPSPSPAELQLLAAEVLARSPESNVLIRGGDRLLARLEPYRQTPEAAPESAPQPSSRLSRLLKRKRAEAASLPASCFNILPDASYLISGGLGELGLETARWLARHGARHLVLIGRSGAATPVQAEAVAELQSQGVQVEIPTVDVADSDALKAVLERIRSNLPPLRGVIHAAGVLRDGLIANQTPEAVRTVFQPKIAGAWHLHQLTLADPLDFFICYSSITAPLGMPGQANYAAANSFLDALMEYRRSLGKPALSIDWGPWYRAEVAALATATAAVPASKRLMLAQFGFHWLEREKGFALLERLLRDQAAHASVMALDLGRFLQALPQTRNLPLLATLAREQGQKLSLRPPHILPKRSPGPPTQPNADQPASTVPLPDPAELERFLLQAIARILSVSPTEINTQTSLRGYGFDSLMALELKAQLQDAYGITLKASERYQSMSIAEMSERIGGS